MLFELAFDSLSDGSIILLHNESAQSWIHAIILSLFTALCQSVWMI